MSETTFAYRRPVHFIETPRGVDIAIDHNAPGVLTPDWPRSPKPKGKTRRTRAQNAAQSALFQAAPKDIRVTAPFERDDRRGRHRQ